MLYPYYQPIGELVSDLHDRPERMLAKGVIEGIVPWEKARTTFFWRLRRRVREEELVSALQAAKMESGDVSELSHDEALKQIHSKLPAETLGDDRRCYEMLANA